jgi:Trypsin
VSAHAVAGPRRAVEIGVSTACTLGLLGFPLLLAACAAPAGEEVGEARSAIEGGAADTRDTGVVGVVLVMPAEMEQRTCSGSLIAPNLVLTAQHCVADTPEIVDCTTSVFGPPAEAALVKITTSESIWEAGAPWIEAAEVMTPPGGDAVCGRDVALIRLARPAAATPLDPGLEAPVEPDEDYAAIGYGRTSSGIHDTGLRRRRDRLHVVCVGDDCDTRQVAAPEWRGDQGVCNGDSGGPAVDGEERVIGVTSRGPAGCERPIYGRIDAHADWIREGARRAALAGGYAAPAWVDAPPSGASCATAPSAPSPRGGPAWLGLAGGLAIAAAARRALRRASAAR